MGRSASRGLHRGHSHGPASAWRSAGPSFRPGFQAPGSAIFNHLDADKDGKISKDEILKHHAELDADHDGNVTKEEMATHVRKKMAAMRPSSQKKPEARPAEKTKDKAPAKEDPKPAEEKKPDAPKKDGTTSVDASEKSTVEAAQNAVLDFEPAIAETSAP